MPQSWIGKSIGGRYQVDSLLGQGGMSAVYRASDPNLRRMVAIKMIHPHLSENPNFVDRFKEEAAAVARLRHPNIVQVYDFNIDGDTYYMVMECLIGETLQARLKRLNEAQRHMPYPEVIRFCSQLCEAVGYAHNHELIHRDIKPANIMLDLNGQAILMDFGIVKIVGGEYHTATGATVGTAMYMSPEQIRSEKVDERSDIYSLGVTLYEMISGQTPYQADSALTLMMMVLNDPLPDLRDLRQGIPESLLAVVEKALAKDKEDRFQTMAEMAAALQRVQLPQASVAEVKTLVDDEQGEPGAVPEAPGAGPAVSEASAAEPERVEASQREEQVVEAPPPKPRQGDHRVSAVPTQQDQAIEAPLSVPQQAAPSRVRGITRPNYRRILMVVAILLFVGAVAALGVIYLRSQKAPAVRLAPINQPPEEINSQTAQFVVSLGRWETGAYIEELAFSPDGKMIGTANNRELLRFAKYRYYGGLWQVEPGRLQGYLPGHTQWVYSVAFSPDGQLLATASDDDRVILWQVSAGSLAREIETSLGGVTSVAFSPNNLLLAAGSWDGRAGLWQVSDGHLLRTLEGHEDSVKDVAFSPDGALLASGSDDNTIRLWQVSDGSLVHSLRAHTGPVNRLAFSTDGSLLASVSDDDTLSIWQVSDGSLVHSLVGHSDSVYAVAFSPDGSLLASGSGDGTLRLWDVAEGTLLHLLAEEGDTITSLAFSPDGRLLVSGEANGALRFWGLSEAIPLERE